MKENSNLFDIAKELLKKDDLIGAINSFKKYIEYDYDINKKYQSMIYLGDLTKDIEWYHKAFIINTNRDPLIKISKHFIENADYQKAICYIKAALEIDYFEPYENELFWMLYYSYWYNGDKKNSKIYFDKCLSNTEIENLEQKHLNDYRYYYDLPKITIIGNSSIILSEMIYPSDKLEFRLDKNDINGEYIIFSESIISKTSIITEYLKKINGKGTNLLTKDEYLLNDEFRIIYIKK